MITDREFDTLAQYNHILMGAVVTLLGLDLFPHYINFIVIGFVIYTAWKEFYYDYRWESVEVRGSSLEDFLFYQLGVVIAWATHLWLLKFLTFVWTFVLVAF